MNRMKKEFKHEPVFKEGDGTVEQRVYSIANTVKRFGTDVAADRHDEKDTVPMWLTNDGLRTRTTKVTFDELGKLVSEVATAANEVQDRKSFGEAN